MKSLPFILLALAALMLANCNGTTVMTLGQYGVDYLTKPKEPPAADTADQIAQHDSWCYETLGYAECYTQAQNTEPNRLINVDPQSKYPLTAHDYWEVVYQGK